VKLRFAEAAIHHRVLTTQSGLMTLAKAMAALCSTSRLSKLWIAGLIIGPIRNWRFGVLGSLPGQNGR
jgi:hypothetical protein